MSSEPFETDRTICWENETIPKCRGTCPGLFQRVLLCGTQEANRYLYEAPVQPDDELVVTVTTRCPGSSDLFLLGLKCNVEISWAIEEVPGETS